MNRGKTKIHRRLGFQRLSDRRLLAVYQVTTTEDTISPNDAELSLREAITLANQTNGPDVIQFAPSLFNAGPVTIDLALGELLVLDAAEINGPGPTLLTIDANEGSRVFRIDQATDPVRLSGLAIRGGRTTTDGDYTDFSASGPAILSTANTEVSLFNVHVSGNHTEGRYARGAVSVVDGSLTVSASEFRGNTTAGYRAHGGAMYVWLKTARLSDVIMIDNHVFGDESNGGAVNGEYADIIIVDSILEQNTIEGYAGFGGAIATEYLTLEGTTVRQNKTTGSYGAGAGIWVAQRGTIVDSDITENRTEGYQAHGAGVFSKNKLRISQTRIADNHLVDGEAYGAAIAFGGYIDQVSLTLEDVTVSGNSGGDGTNVGVSSNDHPDIELEVWMIGGQNALQAPNSPVRVSSATAEGEQFTRWAIGDGTSRMTVRTPRSLTNPIVSSDVNGDGSVTALDALQVINELNRRQFSDQNGEIRWSVLDDEVTQFLDQNFDGQITALDALRVINELNRLGSSALAAPEPLLASPIDRHSNDDAVIENDEAIALLF